MTTQSPLTGHCPGSKARDVLRYCLESSRFEVERFLSIMLLFREGRGGRQQDGKERWQTKCHDYRQD